MPACLRTAFRKISSQRRGEEVQGASLVAEMWGFIGEIRPRPVSLKQQNPVVQCELRSLSETPPPPFWPVKGENPGDRSEALPSWDEEGGGGGRGGVIEEKAGVYAVGREGMGGG